MYSKKNQLEGRVSTVVLRDFSSGRAYKPFSPHYSFFLVKGFLFMSQNR